MPKHRCKTERFRNLPRLSSGLLRAGLVMGFVLGGWSSTASAQDSKKAVVKTDVINTADGWSIPITYYQSTAGKDAAVVVLLHGEGENQLVWKKNGLAERLHKDDFAVISCDLRKHGEAKNPRASGDKSLTPVDFKAMASATRASELECIQDYLFAEHQAGQLNMAKTAIVAAGNMAPVALNWAARDWLKKPYPDAPTMSARTPRGQTVRGMVLLSPSENVPGLSAGPPLKFFRKGRAVAMLFMYGTQDGSARDVRNMLKQVTTPKNDAVIYSESFDAQFKGTDLLDRVGKAQQLAVGLLKKHVQDRKIPWRDRRSRAER